MRDTYSNVRSGDLKRQRYNGGTSSDGRREEKKCDLMRQLECGRRDDMTDKELIVCGEKKIGEVMKEAISSSEMLRNEKRLGER